MKTYGAKGDYESAASYAAAAAIPGVSGLAGKGLSYTLKKTDLDLRGAKVAVRDALEAAFEKTGVAKDQFKVTKWGKDVNGKSVPVEYRAKGGAEVNLDYSHRKPF
ncbi:MAG: polymorphic toxin type 47 domain-containing protein [Bacteroidota bacterium]